MRRIGMLQWGHEHVLAEIAYLISYSIFKDHGPLCEHPTKPILRPAP
jgi:hypothetical protein